jgi:lipid II isoglutaminyl synthase (glutamine-hydrolysing)
MLEIVRIHNELLGTYGDRGNAEVLKYRAALSGIESRISDISYLDPLPTQADIYLLGGAEDAAQLLSLSALKRDGALTQAVEKGAVLLAVCAGFQIIGRTYTSGDDEIEGLGLLDVVTNPGSRRLVGEIVIDCELFNFQLTGFENHSGVTTLGKEVTPFGTVVRGNGNGINGVDGAMNGNIFGTYLHGPVLARNPEFADLLLERAIGSKISYGEDALANRYASWHRNTGKND